MAIVAKERERERKDLENENLGRQFLFHFGVVVVVFLMSLLNSILKVSSAALLGSLHLHCIEVGCLSGWLAGRQTDSLCVI